MFRHGLLVLIFQFSVSIVGFAQILKPSPIEESSPREDLRGKIFSPRVTERLCVVLSKDPAGEGITVDESLQTTIRGILQAIRKAEEKKLRDYFNPRLKIKSGHVLSALMGLKKITGANLTLTNYRIAALNSPDGSTSAIECEDTGILIHPLYGYPLSIGVWLQATGEEEVARVFIELVPDAKAWTIGAWHVQQWTHAGKDFAMWYEQAQASALAKNKGSSYISADIASKLLDGGGFLVFPVKADVDKLRDQQLSLSEWQTSIKNSFPDDPVIHSATMFARGGAAVLVRFAIKEEMSAVAIREHCRSRLRRALQQEWSSAIVGIRCSYNFPREDALKEGVLGGMLVTKEDLKDEGPQVTK